MKEIKNKLSGLSVEKIDPILENYGYVFCCVHNTYDTETLGKLIKMELFYSDAEGNRIVATAEVVNNRYIITDAEKI